MKLKHRIFVVVGLGALLYSLLKGSSKENSDQTISIPQNESDVENDTLAISVRKSNEELELN